MSGLAQPAQKGPGTDLSEAENRLSEMRTQEVGIVDAAANLRPFLTMKSKDGMAQTSKQDAPPAAAPAAAAAAPEAKQGLTLSTAARDTMVAGLTDALEKLTGLAQAVGEATIDEAAVVPPEVGELFKQTAELILGLAGDTAPPAADAAAPAPAAAPVAAAAPAAKDAEPVDKAGKKISASNLKKIKTAMDALKAVLDATETDATAKAAGDDATDDDPAAAVTANVHKMLEGFGTKLDERAAATTAKIDKLAAAVSTKNTTIAEQKAAIEKAKAQIATLSKRANSPGGGNAGTSEGDGGEPVNKNNGKAGSWGDFDRRVNAIGHEPPKAAG